MTKSEKFKGVWILSVPTVYIYFSAVKVNALTQIYFNAANFINARLMQRIFFVWPVIQSVVWQQKHNIIY